MNHQLQKKIKHSSHSAIRSPGPAVPLRHDEHPVIQVRRAVGNQAFLRLLRSGALRAKLTISKPNDMYEQEADRVADQVMCMTDPEVRLKSNCRNLRCSHDGNEENLAMRPKADAGTKTCETSVPDGFVSSLGAGQPLDKATRGYFEPRFGIDFSRVRVHAKQGAALSAGSINAVAYTLGNNMVFGAGQYQPETIQGKRLLAHELTHVLQQGQGAGNSISRAEAPAAPPPAPAAAPAECTVTWSSPLPADTKDCTFKRGVSTSPKHDGVDYTMPEGTSVRAAADGTVLQASDRGDGYGNTVLINHRGKYVTRYGHLSEYKVKKDDKVTKGQVVALSGNTGHTTGPHLHFEIREGGAWGTVLDPKSFITFS